MANIFKTILGALIGFVFGVIVAYSGIYFGLM